MTRILLVDDDPIVRVGLRGLLEPRGVVSEAASTARALDALASEVPDLVVTELVLEGPDGIHLTRAIKASWPELPVLILSSHPESWFAERALLAGASGYVMKDVAVHCLGEAVGVAMAGGIWLSDVLRAAIAPGGPLDPTGLDADERALVAAIGHGNPGPVALADRLGATLDRVEDLTLSTMRKLGLAGRVQLVVRAGQRPGS